MTFESAQGHMKIVNNPFLYTPGYPLGYPTYQRIPLAPLLELSPVNKEKLNASVKEKKKKHSRKKLLKLMILSQMMNNNK